jgi:hypothetical protein
MSTAVTVSATPVVVNVTVTLPPPSAPVAVTLDYVFADATVSDLGNPGPRGPIGLPGVSAPAYLHTQTALAATWIIEHSLNKYPQVTVIVDGGQVFADVTYSTLNRVTIVHGEPTAGLAALI